MADRAHVFDRWSQLMEQLGGIPPEARETAFEALYKHYEEPGRHYHNSQHVLDCLDHLAAWNFDAPRQLPTAQRLEIELALWYHDVIYDTHRKDNEAASAKFFARSPLAPHLEETCVSSVVRLIEITDHRQPPESSLERLIVSIDLATLGASPEIYTSYAEAVRQEYSWVPEADYQSGRAKVLQSFLDRPVIYPDPWFQEHYEAAARRNLAAELQNLAG